MNMKQLMDKGKALNKTGKFMGGFQDHVTGQQLLSPQIGASAVSLEGFGSELEAQNVSNAFDAMESITDQLILSISTESGGSPTDYNDAQRMAATIGGLIGSNPRAYYNALGKSMSAAAGNKDILHTPWTESMTTYNNDFGVEAFDKTENKAASAHSFAYNLDASRQGDVGELFHPTIVKAPGENFIVIDVLERVIHRDIERSPTGSLDRKKMSQINILRTIRNHGYLRGKRFKCIPVFRDDGGEWDNSLLFSDVYVRDVENDFNEVITTASLKFGNDFSILGISQTNNQLSKGIHDNTEALEPGIFLDNLYLVTGVGTFIRFPTRALPYFSFTHTLTGHDRDMMLNASSNNITLVNLVTLQNDATQVDILGLDEGDVVKISTRINGVTNLEDSDTRVDLNYFKVDRVYNADNSVADQVKLDAAIAWLAGLGPVLDILSFELDLYRTNSNRRDRHQLVDSNHWTQRYAVNPHSGFSSILPVDSNENYQAHIDDLITITRIKTTQDSITAIEWHRDNLVSYHAGTHDHTVQADMVGMGRYFVKPWYEYGEINVPFIVDSLTSTDRLTDMRTAIMNYIGEYVIRAYINSEYSSLVEHTNLSGTKPTVILGCGMRTLGYISSQQEIKGSVMDTVMSLPLRMAGTNDARWDNKIFISFGIFDQNRNTKPNPINFGNMFWQPEIPLVIPGLHRDGRTTTEVSVRPIYEHINHLPILIELDIIGIETVVDSKLPVRVNNLELIP